MDAERDRRADDAGQYMGFTSCLSYRGRGNRVPGWQEL